MTVAAVRQGQVGHLVVLPDAQMATDYEHSIFIEQIEYLIQSKPDLVLFTGDMTDTNLDPTWAFVAAQLARLTAAGVVWLPVMGNHDYDWSQRMTTRVTGINTYLAAPAVISGLKDAGHVENSYSFVYFGGRKWMVLILEYSPRTATVAWAHSIIAANLWTPTILVTHSYLYRDGTRYDYASKGDAQQYSPHDAATNYQLTPGEGAYDGEEIWQALVKNASSIRIVISGHDVFSNARRTDVRADGTLCHQFVNDYQEVIPNNWGLLREYRFDEAVQRLDVRTYGTSAKRFYVTADSTFSLPMP